MDNTVADQPIAQARANISELCKHVRFLGQIFFLTSRGKREVAVVPVELGELAEKAGGSATAISILKEHLETRP
ncbi:prevent-host-death family protein [Streptomyces omiyaensis]|uniref:prevent-host-death family protein n=1 Tax=Streptomyces omiyaensis TaxID=68247 RepID=UPI0036F8BF8C